MQNYPVQGLWIFLRRDFSQGATLSSRRTLKFLKELNSLAYFLVLQHTVFKSDFEEVEQCHRELAELYLDFITKHSDLKTLELSQDDFSPLKCEITSSVLIGVMQDCGPTVSFESASLEDLPLQDVRALFCDFLSFSSFYDARKIFKAVSEHYLNAEAAIVLSSLKEHHQALRKIVFDVKDFMWAETYCLSGGLVNFNKYKLEQRNPNSVVSCDEQQKKDLLLLLLKVYLQDGDLEGEE